MKLVIFGAGSIGSYVGGCLLAARCPSNQASAAGRAPVPSAFPAFQAALGDVVLVGRERTKQLIQQHGLTLTDLHGGQQVLRPEQVAYTTDAALLAGAHLVLVTVKSADTEAAAQAIAQHAPPTVVVLSLQNGVGNAETLRRLLPGRTVVAGMVPFNVVALPNGGLHRGTFGDIAVEDSPALAPWLPWFAAAGVPLQPKAHFQAVQWGKLLLNLNNPINALSGLPLKAQLSQRAYRRCLALLMTEALVVLKAAGIQPDKVAKVGPALLPHVLRLPDAVFKRVAAAMLSMDEQARSSMWEDLAAGRRTEVDYLNGAVVALAQSLGLAAPANARVVTLIRAAEAGRSGGLSGDALLAELAR